MIVRYVLITEPESFLAAPLFLPFFLWSGMVTRLSAMEGNSYRVSRKKIFEHPLEIEEEWIGSRMFAEKVMIMDNFLAAEPKILRRALDVVRAFLRRFRLTPSSTAVPAHAHIVFYRIFFCYITYV